MTSFRSFIASFYVPSAKFQTQVQYCLYQKPSELEPALELRASFDLGQEIQKLIQLRLEQHLSLGLL